MNKQVLLFTFLLSITSFSVLLAQNKLHKVIGTTDSDAVRGIIQQPDGTLILAGFTSRFTAPFDDGLIVALDPVGDTVFTAIVQTPLSDKINAIESGQNGNFYVAGMAGHPGGNFEEDPFVAKFDAFGNRIWAKTYGDSTFQSDHFNAIACDTIANVIYATGRSQAQTLVVKIDASNGNALWANQYGVGEGNTIAVRTDGDVVVGGEDSGTGTIIMIDDTTGIPLKSSEYSTDFGMKVLDVIKQDACILVLGVTNQPSSGDDVFLMKIDYDGNILWKKKYGNNGTNQATSMVQADDTTIVVAGLYNQVGNITSYSWVMAANAAQDGDTIANSFYQAGNGGVELTDVLSMIPDNFSTSSGYVFTGTDLGSASGDNNFYVMETDTTFNRGGCPPSKLNVSDFDVDTFAVAVTENTSYSPTTLEVLDAGPSTEIDPEGIVEISEDMKAELNGQYMINGMTVDTVRLDVFGRDDNGTPYEFSTTKKLQGESVFSFLGLTSRENIVRTKGSIDSTIAFKTFFGLTTRWEEATTYTFNGCETIDIGALEGLEMANFEFQPSSNSLKGDLILAPDYPDPNTTVEDVVTTFQPIGLLYKKDSPISTPIPQTEFSLDTTAHFDIANVPMTNLNESYEIHLDMPGWPIINPHTNITTGNRLTGDPCYGFMIHEGFLEGFVTVDPNTAISTPSIHDFEMQVYPNPASKQVSLTFSLPQPDAKVIMADFWGQEVYVHRGSLALGQQAMQIPVSDFAAGIYTIRIEIDGLGRQVKKIQIR